ncbi:hypothetical protein A2U01_0055761 [Trifolium medium]|uniref:Uncharacterized protein n=1 Tax=Trifolium medium TaxID=97028 RepID=A0A392RD79_9FABA|nr:hypothetical protein [Trifolium medium]
MLFEGAYYWSQRIRTKSTTSNLLSMTKSQFSHMKFVITGLLEAVDTDIP